MAICEFYFDFGSPNAYLAHRAFPQILERTGASIVYKPVLLGGIFKATGNQAPFVSYGHIKPKIEYDMLEIERFVKRYSVENFKFNSNFPLNTVALMRAAIWAEQNGRLDEYVEAAMIGFWEQDQKLDDPEVFSNWFSAHGFDGPALLAATQDQAIKDALKDVTQAAVERNMFGIPTFFVNDEIYFGKDRLWLVEEALSQ